jgi:hypothetical protein
MDAGRSVPSSTLRIPQFQTGLRSGSLWFYLIGALALAHTLILALGFNLSVIGLGVSARLAESGAHMGRTIIFNCWAAGLFLLLGLFVDRAERWAFLGGVALYAVDGLLLLYSHNYLGAALHGVLLFGIFRGMALPIPAAQMLRRTEAARKAA